MSTPAFEDPNGQYRVLNNAEGQYSLWPAWAGVPAGWRVVYEQGDRETCLSYVAQRWTDMRPTTIRSITDP